MFKPAVQNDDLKKKESTDYMQIPVKVVQS